MAVVTLTLSHPALRAHGASRVCCIARRQTPWLFLTDVKPPNPPTPPARVMWLRKRLKHRRLLEPYWDWMGRRLAWRLAPRPLEDDAEPEAGPQFITLCLRDGIDVVETLPEPAGGAWESEGCEVPWEPAAHGADLKDPSSWRAEAGITPRLRKALALGKEKPGAAAALVEALALPVCEAFHVWDDELVPWPAEPAAPPAEPSFGDVLMATAWRGETLLAEVLERAASHEERADAKAQRKRLSRAQKSLAAEASRVETLRRERATAELLKRHYHLLPTREKRVSVTVPGETGEAVVIPLDPRRTVAENVDRLFARAAKGDRGAATLAARREALSEQVERLQEGKTPPPRQRSETPLAKGKSSRKRANGGEQVARFRTSDGFIALRGKNAKANHALVTRMANAFDYWFHAEDGPGAHVVLRRDHPSHEPPRQSLEEAAALAGLKSWQAGENKARVMCALVKHVRPVKGGAPGQVRVDEVLMRFDVALDDELESRLADELP